MVDVANAKICKDIGGFVTGDSCYINDLFLFEADIDCEGIHLDGINLKTEVDGLLLCKIPLGNLGKIPDDKLNLLKENELNRTIREEPVGMVVTKKGVPAVGITTSGHRALSEDTLKDAIGRTLAQKDRIREEVGESWFPAGFANLRVRGDDPFVRFVKKHGRKEDKFGTVTYYFDNIHMRKNDYRGGYDIYLDYDARDATESQSLNFKVPLYTELQKQLALLGVRTEIETLVD